MQQVIHSSNLIMLVLIEAGGSKFPLEAKLLKVAQHLGLYRNLILANN